MSNTDDELHRIVLGIVNDIEAAAAGDLYDVDGENVIIQDMDAWKEEQYRKKVDEFRDEHPEESFDPEETGCDTYEEWMESEIDTVDDIDEPDEVSLSEYVDRESLGDVRFEVDSSKDLHGGKVLFCYGGPNVWVADDEVRGYWGSSTVEMSLDSRASSAMWDWFEEMWNVAKEM